MIVHRTARGSAIPGSAYLSGVRSSCLATSHNRIVLSQPAEASIFPPGAKRTDQTGEEWPLIIAHSLPVATSRSITSPRWFFTSPPPDAKVFQSWLKAKDVTSGK
jgi:hypothetical protein